MWPRGQKLPGKQSEEARRGTNKKTWGTNNNVVLSAKSEPRDASTIATNSTPPVVMKVKPTVSPLSRPNAWGVAANSPKSKASSPLQEEQEKARSPPPQTTGSSTKRNAWGQTQTSLQTIVAPSKNAAAKSGTPGSSLATHNGQNDFPSLSQQQQQQQQQPEQSKRSYAQRTAQAPSTATVQNQFPTLSRSQRKNHVINDDEAAVNTNLVSDQSADKKGKKRKPKFGGSMSDGDPIPTKHVLLKKKSLDPDNNTKAGVVAVSTSKVSVKASRLVVDAPPFIPSSEFPALKRSSIQKATGQPSPLTTKQRTKEKAPPSPSQTVDVNGKEKSSSSPKKHKKKKQQKTQASGILQSTDDEPKMDAFHSAAALGGFFPMAQGQGSSSIDNGGHFDLLRLYGDGMMGVQKGRQRIRPRKKKFTSLKKKVLEERLRKWKELHRCEKDEVTQSADDVPPAAFSTVCLYGYCDQDELKDDEEYEEIVANIFDMATKITEPKRVFIPRTLPEDSKRDAFAWPVFVEFEDVTTEGSAMAAMQCWNGLVLGGQILKCCPMVLNNADDVNENRQETEQAWQEWCLLAEQAFRSKENEDVTTEDIMPGSEGEQKIDIILEKALTEDDLEDEECLEESLNDLRAIAGKYGQVENLHVVEHSDPPLVRLVYIGNTSIARHAIDELSKLLIGGQEVLARLADDSINTHSFVNDDGFFIRIHNVLTEDDLEDEECLEESLNDVRELAQQFGQVKDVVLDTTTQSSDEVANKTLRVYFTTSEEVKAAVNGFDGMVIGGSEVSVSEGMICDPESAMTSEPPANQPPEPMYSGDKFIPERFAECKRVPKIVNNQTQRQYATLATDDAVKPLLSEMLGELMRLQRRAIEENNTKAKRRLVMGLREVARGIRSHKVKMVVMANNLDEYGIIDEKLQEIIDLSQTEGVPVFYEFSKRSLGKAIGKSIRVAVVGVQNAEGAHQQFKKLVQLASKLGMA